MSLSRRSFLKAGVVLGASANLARTFPSTTRRQTIAVVGAGAFGGWTALHLLRQGGRVKVTLIDAWGPGNSRASSGGETRVIRGTYGSNKIYAEMSARSLRMWKENEARWRRKLYFKTGALWLIVEDTGYETSALAYLNEAGWPFEKLSVQEAARRYPQISFDHAKWCLFEKDAGYIIARQSCQVVLDAFLAEGGEYRQLAVTPGTIRADHMDEILLSDGTKFHADQYVFACGPWLGRDKFFPDVLGSLIQPSRQEVFYFGTPAGDQRFQEGQLPVWIDHGTHLFYGIPGNERRGLKVADDTHGPPFNPTSDQRLPTPETLQAARSELEFRFPDMKGAPLLEARVCQYENSPDGNFIIDRHPAAANVWFAGGGTGHGFKHGPAVGELVASLVLGKRAIEPFFALSRFKRTSPSEES